MSKNCNSSCVNISSETIKNTESEKRVQPHKQAGLSHLQMAVRLGHHVHMT